MNVREWWARQSQLTEAAAARWEDIRSRGRRRYILRYGVLEFAVPVAVLGAVVHYLLDSPGSLWGRLALKLALAPITGWAFGAMTWHYRERSYLEWRNRSRTDSPRHG